jgi:AraC-like DNA-binding protein
MDLEAIQEVNYNPSSSLLSHFCARRGCVPQGSQTNSSGNGNYTKNTILLNS